MFLPSPLEGSWSLQFVEGEQLEADDDEGFNQRFLVADISSSNLTMPGGKHYSPNAGTGPPVTEASIATRQMGRTRSYEAAIRRIWL